MKTTDHRLHGAVPSSDRKATPPGLAGLLLLAAFAALIASGCKSSTADTQFTVSVTITNHTLLEIETATAAVFQQQGYYGEHTGPGEFVFEKVGTSMENLTYGNWMGGGLWIRVVISTHSQDAARTLLGCDAYQVLNHGDRILEEATKMSKRRHRQYKELLQQVAARLK